LEHFVFFRFPIGGRSMSTTNNAHQLWSIRIIVRNWKKCFNLKFNILDGFDTLNPTPTDKQAARAANITWAALLFRRMIDRQEVSPVGF